LKSTARQARSKIGGIGLPVAQAAIAAQVSARNNGLFLPDDSSVSCLNAPLITTAGVILKFITHDRQGPIFLATTCIEERS
jgi:hypothetical protein